MRNIESTGSYLAITTLYLPTEDGGDYHKQHEDSASSQTLRYSLTVRQRVGGGWVGDPGQVLHQQCAGSTDSFLGFQIQHDHAYTVCSIRTTSSYHLNRCDVTSFGCDGWYTIIHRIVQMFSCSPLQLLDRSWTEDGDPEPHVSLWKAVSDPEHLLLVTHWFVTESLASGCSGVCVWCVFVNVACTCVCTKVCIQNQSHKRSQIIDRRRPVVGFGGMADFQVCA